jgi:DNA (cytosine-5)-methyltransferase 1
MLKMLPRKIEAIDLFCGVGGLSCGLMEAKINVVAGIDIDPVCRVPFEANHRQTQFITCDVRALKATTLKALWSQNAIKLLAGCAPCQPFSSYARSKATTHGKWGMLFEFARLVGETLPELVTMENVPGLASQTPFHHFVSVLQELNYHITYAVLNAADFGVPQHRKRLVLLASRLGTIDLPETTHHGPNRWISVRQAISHLPRLSDGQVHTQDALHRAAQLSALNQQRVRASRPGGTWRDWPRTLVAKCHQKESGKNSSGVYGRMEWDKPAPTMTTLCNGYGNGRFGHPEQDRAISLREAAIFQSFPLDYHFCDASKPISTKAVARLIGNAVPPRLGAAVGRALVESVGR